MGIYDRHYIRDEGPPPSVVTRGRRAMRMWSVNTWLIVINVAVFVVDGFLPVGPVQMGLVIDAPSDRPVNTSTLVEGPVTVTDVGPGNVPRAGYQTVGVRTGSGVVPVGRYRIQFMHPLERFLHFSTQRGFFEVQFWRLIGFQFLHSHDTLMHILFNMIGLYFFGAMVETALGSKRYLAFYLLCGISGALMYSLLNIGGYVAMAVFGLTTPIPGLLFHDFSTPLIGASAGVFGILMAGAYLAPHATVLLFFLIPMRLRTLAYAIVAIALFTIIRGGPNAGGEAGHLGGALAGFYLIRHPHHLHGFFDFLGWFDPTSHHYRGGRRGGPARAPARGRRRGGADRVEVDRILDKVHAQGLSSLSDTEKRILREASERG